MDILAIMAGGMEGDAESGRIGEAVRAAGGTLQWCYRRFGDQLPATTDGFDALIVFGGEPSVYDPQLADYFAELDLVIRRFHGEGKPILGSCLGSQAIARAFGAEVRPQGFLEYGFTRLTRTIHCATDPLLHSLAAYPVLFEMHSDTFDLPPGAVPLLEGDQVRNQAYRLGDSTWGFQCHFEVTADIAATWTQRELIGNPNRDQAMVAALVRQLEDDFVRFQQAQTEFAFTLMARWLEQVKTAAGQS
ncbi:MAG: type 1 glutamine amidotransferase [Pseudomonadota bacterium]|nr:type 1 glutamine amidotransferase [Pseudomonadota bacterium]